MDICDVGSAKIAYRIFGSGDKTLVIDTGLASCSAEWWHIGEALSSDFKVIVYDRAGYGKSTSSSLSRTPENIAHELDKLLYSIGIDNFTLIGHSQGGFNAIQYALMFPQKVHSLVLLDPATPFDDEFTKRLTEDEYKNSGVDKTKVFKLSYRLMALGLGFILRPLLAKAPPFCYHSYSNEEKEYLLGSLTRKSTYKAVLDEYAYTHDERYSKTVKDAIEKTSLNDLHVKLITHSSDVYVKELEYYGNMDKQTATKIEALWQEIMKKCLNLSAHSEHVVASQSGHYIHLTDYKVLREACIACFA